MPGQTHNGLFPGFSQNGWFSGLNGNAVKQKLACGFNDAAGGFGCHVVNYGIVVDDEALLSQKVNQAIAECDAVLLEELWKLL